MKNQINGLRKKHEFRQFQRRVWKEVELAQRHGVHFEPYMAIEGDSPAQAIKDVVAAVRLLGGIV